MKMGYVNLSWSVASWNNSAKNVQQWALTVGAERRPLKQEIDSYSGRAALHRLEGNVVECPIS